MKGSVVLLLAGLAVSGLVLAGALVPPKTVEDERFRLDPSQPNYGDGTGGGGFAIGLPDMAAGDRVNASWDLDRAYDVRILPDANGEPPHVTDVAPLHAADATAEGNATFAAPADGSYWLTFTVPQGEKLERGTVLLHWDPPLTRAQNPIYLDLGVTLLVLTLGASAGLEWAVRRRDRKRAVRP